MHNVALATAREWADLVPDERLVLEPLRELGVNAAPFLWDDPEVDWTRFDAVVIRCTWDYSWRIDEFRNWIDRLDSAGVRLWNPLSVVRPNLDKTYLRDLPRIGLETIPTVWLDCGAVVNLDVLLREQGWDEAIIKPVISAGARHTWRTNAASATRDAAKLVEQLAEERVMIQPFLPEILDEGEWSMIFIGGEHSHTVMKTPKTGDFRVQEQHGGITRPAVAPEWMLGRATDGLRALAPDLLYARVDGVRVGDRFFVLEMELTEPRLFFGAKPGSERQFARELAKRLV